MLKPALRRLWRDPVTLQLGIDPARAVVLTGIDAVDTSVLDLLDGSRDLHDVVAVAAQQGVEPGRVHDLLTALRGAAALDDAPAFDPAVDPRLEPDSLALSLLHPLPGAATAVIGNRRRRAVSVHGAGRVGATVANLLAAAGVGTVTVIDGGTIRAADVAPGGLHEPTRGTVTATSRGTAAQAAVDRWGASPGPAAPADITVLAPTGPAVPPEILAAVRDRPHLPVLIRDTTSGIGPLVLPGASPCLRCVELNRSDRDPAWPAVWAQVVGDSRRVEPCDVVLATLAASLAALQVLTVIDGYGEPSTLGAVLEFGLHDPRLRRRAVRAHPGCGCGAST